MTTGLGNELPTVALVDDCLVINIDLTLVVVVDERVCRHVFIRGVVIASELAIELKLHRGMLPLLVVITENSPRKEDYLNSYTDIN